MPFWFILLSLLLFVSLLYSLSRHPSPPLSLFPTVETKRIKWNLFFSVSAVSWISLQVTTHISLLSLPFVSSRVSCPLSLYNPLLFPDISLPISFSLSVSSSLRWAPSQVLILGLEQHRAAAKPPWDIRHRGQGQLQWVTTHSPVF